MIPAQSKLIQVKISDINPDPSGIQPRVELDSDMVKRYAELMVEGTVFPPVRVWDIEDGDGGKMRISDGYHRYAAAKSISKEHRRYHITAEIHVGTMLECMADAIRCNAIHGKSITLHERKQAIRSYLGKHVAAGNKSLPSTKFLMGMAGTSKSTTLRVIREFEASPAADAPFEDSATFAAPVEPSTSNTPSRVRESDGGDDENEDGGIENAVSEALLASETGLHDAKVVCADLRSEIKSVMAAYEQCCKMKCGDYFLKHRADFEKAVGVMRKLEEYCRPEQVCSCEAQGCSGCGGRGWLNGHQVKNGI